MLQAIMLSKKSFAVIFTLVGLLVMFMVYGIGQDNVVTEDAIQDQHGSSTVDSENSNNVINALKSSKETIADHNSKEVDSVEHVIRHGTQTNGTSEFKGLSNHEVKKKVSELFEFKFERQFYGINVSRSLEVPLVRDIANITPLECHQVQYPLTLPLVSIIIPFHAEHYTVLIRLLHSIFSTVQTSLLKEIILVDDANEDPNFGAPLDKYITDFPMISIIRLKERHGLIKARMAGARAASGDVLLFVDAHVEMERDWLEPLLHLVQKEPMTIAVPHIPAINGNTLQPVPTKIYYGSFTWELDYFWMSISKQVQDTYAITDPVPTATMIGAAFAVQREHFFSVGAFDEGMEQWGGENLELSFRNWMCGGSIKLVRCSVVYHIFRGTLPYKVDQSNLYKNLQRVASVIMGEEYQEHYYHTVGKVFKFNKEEQHAIEKRKELMRQLQCRDFKWYLSNVAPNILAPPRLAVFWGQMKNLKANGCLTSDLSSYTSVSMHDCPIYQPSQIFYYNTDNQIVHQKSGKCLVSKEGGPSLGLETCELFKRQHTWSFNPIHPDSLTALLQGVDTRKPVGALWMRTAEDERVCLETKRHHTGIVFPLLTTCDMLNLDQYWVITHKIDDRIYAEDAFS